MRPRPPMEASAGVVGAESAGVKPFGVSEPLTERVLGRLGPPRWFWIVVWALTSIGAPLLLLAVPTAVGEPDRVVSASELVISQAVPAYAVVLCLWGVGRLFRTARA